ncbi:MAG TPA: hypothetical protein VF845_01855 [Terriglobales bacterium]
MTWPVEPQDFHRMLERRPLLHPVVVQEPEVTTLGKDNGFVMKRAVFEAEHQPAGHLIAAGDLQAFLV